MCSDFRSAFVSVQIQCLPTNSCNFLQKVFVLFRHTSTTTSANGPFSQSRPHIVSVVVEKPTGQCHDNAPATGQYHIYTTALYFDLCHGWATYIVYIHVFIGECGLWLL